MAQRNNSSTGSGSNEANAHSSTASSSRRGTPVTRIRRDPSVELEESGSESEYSESEDASDAEESHARPTKRARDDSGQGSRAKYAFLKTETRQVEAEVIKKKWRPTTAAAQTKVRTVLSLVERPVINAKRDPESRKEAQSSLAALSRIIETRLPRMPFPPETKEWHFDYEAILRNNRDLEHQLAAAKHSSALARGEIEKEKRLLNEAKAELAELKSNANAEKSYRSKRERGTTQVWKGNEDIQSDDGTNIGLQASRTESAQTLSIDAKNFSFVEDLATHLDNIESNVLQLEGLNEMIDHASAVLAEPDKT